MLKDNILLGKNSVNEIIFELSKMERIVGKSGAEYFGAVPKRMKKIVDLFSDMIPMGQIWGKVRLGKIMVKIRVESPSIAINLK